MMPRCPPQREGGRMNKTERIFKIEQLIAARKSVSFETLLAELEVSRATLKRDLEYLRSRMKTPIVYDCKRRQERAVF
jgi:predicted DNA-binding transcriptional regulator YafY